MKVSAKIIALSLMMAAGAYHVQAVAAEAPAIEVSAKETPQVKVYQGHIDIEIASESTAHVAIYALTGQMVKQVEVAPGTTTIDLPQGIYIVRIGHHTVKVAVK